MTTRRGVAAAAVCGLMLVGCARGDGRELRPPPPGATAPTTTTDPSKIGTASTTARFALSSPAFADGQPLPVDHTCDGSGSPPPVRWSAPPDAVELALIVTDRDETGAVHWVVSGMAPTDVGLDPSAPGEGTIDLGYDPPCPPAGEPPHHYVFTLYALGSPLAIQPDMPLADAALLIQRSPAQAAQLTATYGR
ncbi:MAG: YbhB/YbcL family Raf kinase inhibitor-like protein [Acidimicrobiales bacterium]